MNNSPQKIRIDGYGNKRYYNDKDQLHREDGPAIEWPNGSKEWCINGQLHREDGPAYEVANGTKFWYIHGKLHRTDGPAIEYPDGTKFWYINGKRLSEEEFNRHTKNPCKCPDYLK